MSHSNNYRTRNNTQPKFCKFSYVDYIVIASSLSIIISEDLDATDINILATFFAVLADELALISSIKSCPSDNNTLPTPDVALTSSDFTSDKKRYIKKRIKKVKRKKVVKK